MKRLLMLIPSSVTVNLLVAQPDADGMRSRSLADHGLHATVFWSPGCVLVSLGLVLLLIGYLIMVRNTVTPPRVIRFLSLGALLLVFESLRLLLLPAIGQLSQWSPLLLLPLIVTAASVLIALHFRMEKWTVAKLEKKNKRVRLANARRMLGKI